MQSTLLTTNVHCAKVPKSNLLCLKEIKSLLKPLLQRKPLEFFKNTKINRVELLKTLGISDDGCLDD